MSAALAYAPPMTLSEFLSWEDRQEERFEWDGTQPIAMVGETLRHSQLASRVLLALHPALRGGPCNAFLSGVRVLTERGTRMRYPDLIVTCSPIRPGERVVPNPVLILEVLSESTAATDRGAKRAEYGALPSLRRYVMLTQDAPIAVVCDRDADFAERHEHAALALPEFGVTIPLATLYEGLLDLA